MKNIIFKALFVASGLTFTTGCSDFLDADNKAAIESDKYFTDDDGLAALRIAMYSGLKNIVNNTDFTEWGTDLYIVTRSTSVNDYDTYKITPETSGVNSFYKSFYKIIDTANYTLKMSESNQKYAAEAKFIRSLCYYHLVQHFGAVPYVVDHIDSAIMSFPRTNVKTIYDALIAELESIADCQELPERDLEGNISRRAVRALLAKICLAAGWDCETTLTDAVAGTYSVTSDTYFLKAAQWADKVIDGQQLTMSFEDKWSPDNEGNEEEILSVQYDRGAYPGDLLTGGHGRQNTYGCQLGTPETSGFKSCNGSLCPSKKAIYLWDKGDERLDGTFMTTIYNYTGIWPTTGYYAYYTASKSALETMPIYSKYFPWWQTKQDVENFIAANQHRLVKGANAVRLQLIADESTKWEFNDDGTVNRNKTATKGYIAYCKEYTAPTYTCKKFDDPNSEQQSSSSNGYRDIVMFHLSDFYLVAAEAYLLAGNETKALSYVNEVRTRAKASTLTSFADYKANYTTDDSFGTITPLDVILDERARELFAETTRWVDLHRTRQLVRYNIAFNENINTAADMSDVYGNIRWLRPIPAAEIETNTAITEADQNPGY